LSFELADTGSGFDQAEARRLFEDFTQGDATFTRRHGGSGLGLALARRLCRLLGGEISATGEKGRGACFTFSIRARRCRVAHGEPTPALAEGTCVLNAMDAGVDAEHLQAFLERWRLPVVRAGQSLPEGTRHAIVLLSLGSAEAMRARLEALADATAGRTAEYLAVSALGTSAEGAAYPEAITACLPMCRENLRLLLRNAGPRARVPQLREPSPEPAAPAPARTVLVVEDNPVNTRVAGLILSRLGHRILTASNGLEGIERLRDEPIDLVLMDLQMPVMDGLEATRRIREGEAGESRRNVPIVAVTTCLDFDNREKLVHAGLTDFIGKPLKPEYIRAAVGRYCLAEPSQSET
jgi:CheY-like chemotaxis protein